MTRCRNVQNKLSAYQDGELDAKDQKRIARHLQECPVCRREFADLENTWQSLERFSEIQPAADFYVKLERRIKQERDHRFLRRLRNIFQLLPASAAAFALLVIAIVAGAYAGNILAQNRFRPRPHHDTVFAQEITLASLDAFDPMPPGTLAEGYMRIACNGLEGHR